MEKDIKIKIIELYNLLDNIGWDISETKETLENLEISINEKEENSIKDVENLNES